MTLVEDGEYFIISEYYWSAAGLMDGSQWGPVSSWNSSDEISKWKVKNLGDNNVTLESTAAPGTYASAYIPNVNGVPITGSPNPTIWNIREKGVNKVSIQSSIWAWYLSHSDMSAPILLQTFKDTADMMWKFVPTGGSK